MISWERFVSRRNIDFEKFKIEHNIATKQDLIEVCLRYEIKSPTQEQLIVLFPETMKDNVERNNTPEDIFKFDKSIDNKKTKGAKNK